MRSDTTNQAVKIVKTGISPSWALGLLFLALKLMGYITWPWVWVTAPFWAPFAFAWGLVIGATFTTIIAAAIGAAIVYWSDRK